MSVSRWALCTRRSRTASFVPVLDGELTGHDGRTAAVAVFHDLQQIAALLGEHRRQTPVIEDEQVDARKHFEEPGMLSVAAGEREHVEQPRQPPIDD